MRISMGKRTLKRKTLKRKKCKRTLRGGVSAEDIQNIIKSIKYNDDRFDEDDGFSEHLFDRLAPIDEIAHRNGHEELLDVLGDIHEHLHNFKGTLDEAEQARLTVDQIPALRDDLISSLENTINLVITIPNYMNDAEGNIARPITVRMIDEIRAEIMFIQGQFNRLN